MATPFTKLVRLSVAIAAALALFEISAAPAAQRSGSAMSDAQATYQQDRSACLNGRSAQDQATCLKEAGAARAAAQRGNLTDGPGQLRRNAKDRCSALSGGERSDCLARMNGQGTVSGSVEGGGILREKVTIEPSPAGGSDGNADGSGRPRSTSSMTGTGTGTGSTSSGSGASHTGPAANSGNMPK